MDCFFGGGNSAAVCDYALVCVRCVSVLLRLCMNLESLEGFVLILMDSRSIFRLFYCSCRVSIDVSLFNVCILLATSCEGSCRMR